MIARSVTPDNRRAVSQFHLWPLLAPCRPDWPRNAREVLSRYGEKPGHKIGVSRYEKKKEDFIGGQK